MAKVNYSQLLQEKSKDLRANMSVQSKLLREVEDALRRIATDNYGVCQECGEGISAKRLAVAPWARFCATCQDLASHQRARGEEPEEEQ